LRPNLLSDKSGECHTSIGNGAFYGCTGLTSITIPKGVASIGHEAFSGCKNLKTVTVSRKTAMGYNTFPSRAQITYSD